jgi:hypothetical protein
MVGSRAPRSAAESSSALLELDSELGCLLSPERAAAAVRDIRVRLTSIATGEWDGARLVDADPAHYGLLVLEGVMAREVVLHSMVSTELLGPGDVVRPWRIDGSPQLLPVSVRWNALSAVRIALLDRRVAAQLGAYPEIGAVIVDRLSDRAQRLTVTQAISQLNRVEERLLALFWHLAERWGRVAADGVAVPLALSHRLIGELVGARRPTVSTALAELARRGEVTRREDGTWMLTGSAPVPEDAAEVIRQRRTLIPAEQSPEAPAASDPSRRDELIASFASAQETAEQRGKDLEVLQLESNAIRARTVALRRERAERLDNLLNAGRRRR